MEKLNILLVTLILLSSYFFIVHSLPSTICGALAEPNQIPFLRRVPLDTPVYSDQIGFFSKDCETKVIAGVSGISVQYLIRKYTFLSNSSYIGVHYVYNDAGCSSPKYKLIYSGSITFFGYSQVLIAATNVTLTSSIVTLTPYSTEFATYMNSLGTCGSGYSNGIASPILNNYCPEIGVFAGDESPKYDIIKFQSNAIYFGAPTTDGSLLNTPQKRPNSYGLPLYKPSECNNATFYSQVCSQLNADPPILTAPTISDASTAIGGIWLSEKCESRPNGQFVVRIFKISSDSSSRLWTGYIYIYSDQDCTGTQATLELSGTYSVDAARSSVSPSGTNATFAVDSLIVSPLSTTMLSILNNAKASGTCGTGANFTLGIGKDVTSSGGCPGVFFGVPALEYELVKVQNNSLYFGARPTDGLGISTPERRPLSYQVPLFPVSQCFSIATSGVVTTARGTTAMPTTGHRGVLTAVIPFTTRASGEISNAGILAPMERSLLIIITMMVLSIIMW